MASACSQDDSAVFSSCNTSVAGMNTHVETKHVLLHDPRMPREGDRVCDRYQILNVVGEGGFAVVYRALDTKLGGELALKVLDPNKSLDQDFAKRFQQEISLVRQLKHHNTIKVWDAGLTEKKCLYMATEFVTGEGLDELIRRTNGLPVDRTIRIVKQILRSLAEAHRVGIVHRDLKPANIMVCQLDGESDYIKVLDFGIAKTMSDKLSMVKTQTGQVMCTPSYASIEVLQNQNVQPASDIYSVGLIAVEMLTGKQAVQGDSVVQVIAQQVSPEPIEIPPQIAQLPIGQVLAKATQKQVENRYTNATEMIAALENVAPAAFALAVPNTPGALPDSIARDLTMRRAAEALEGGQRTGVNRALLLVAAGVLLCAVVVVVIVLRQGDEADDSDRPVETTEAVTVTTTEPGVDEPAAHSEGLEETPAVENEAEPSEEVVLATPSDNVATGDAPEGEAPQSSSEAAEEAAMVVLDPALPTLVVTSDGAEDGGQLQEVRLSVSTSPAGAEIRTTDGAVLASTPFEGVIRSDLGIVTLELTHARRRTARVAVDMSEDELVIDQRLRRMRDDDEPPTVEADDSSTEEVADPFAVTRTYHDGDEDEGVVEEPPAEDGDGDDTQDEETDPFSHTQQF